MEETTQDGSPTAKCCTFKPDEKRVEEVVIQYLRRLEGRLKTFVEAITDNDEQCKARKAIVASMLWDEGGEIIEHIEDLFAGGDKGIPDLG